MEPILEKANFYEEMTTKLNHELCVTNNFDLIHREFYIASMNASYYCVDGFCKDELLEKIMQYFIEYKKENLPDTAKEFAYNIPYVEVELTKDMQKAITWILSGMFALVMEKYDEIILIDARTYPARNVTEPDKDKVLRGSKDGFVETLIFNTALIRRRIRSTDLRIEITSCGETSKTDIALCYMSERVDQKFLKQIQDRIHSIEVDALTLNQESLAECLYPGKWINPFPKFKYTERPDTAVAQILEGSIVLLVDNSPSAMILPVSILDMIQESDDFNFPPITGSYLRLSRLLILLIAFFLTPTFLLLCKNPAWIPASFSFIEIADKVNVPLIWQFLILELAIDGMRLGAVNTPNMLSTPFSILAGIVLGEFSVKSGWFNSEVMLYMAFVAISTYTHPSYELGYAIKFYRMITLILVSLFNVFGYIAGILFFVISIINNKMVSGQSYLYPLIPFEFHKLTDLLFRKRLTYKIKEK